MGALFLTKCPSFINAGFKWTFGKTMASELVLGFRHAQVDANGKIDRGDISMSFNLVGGVTPVKLRAEYFNVPEKVQSEVVSGYDFSHGLFAGVSAQGPYSNNGVDYLLNASSLFEPFFMLNTLQKMTNQRLQPVLYFGHIIVVLVSLTFANIN